MTTSSGVEASFPGVNVGMTISGAFICGVKPTGRTPPWRRIGLPLIIIGLTPRGLIIGGLCRIPEGIIRPIGRRNIGLRGGIPGL